MPAAADGVPISKSNKYSYSGSDRRGYSVLPGAGAQMGKTLGPPPSLAKIFASQLGFDFSFEFQFEQAMMMFQPVGGMDQIPYALTKTIGPSIVRYHSPVLSITNRQRGVEVTYRDAHGATRVEQGDYCIAAMPPKILARTPHNLGANVTAALRYGVPQPVGKIGLEYRRRWWEQDHRIYGGITTTDMDIGEIWYPSYGFHNQRGVVLGYYTIEGDALAYGALAPDKRTSRAVTQDVKVHGDAYRDELSSAFSMSWHRTPFIEGGWTSWPTPNSRQYRLLNQPIGNVYFAGDWLTQWIGWQHGAFIFARKVVTELHQRVAAG